LQEHLLRDQVFRIGSDTCFRGNPAQKWQELRHFVLQVSMSHPRKALASVALLLGSSALLEEWELLLV